MAYEDAYCTASLPPSSSLLDTLILSDSFLPGAAVLAHSLRDAGTTKKLACLVAGPMAVSTINELKNLYDFVLPIERLATPTPATLYLMGRPDLLFTFTKIELWRQTQFRRLVYLDSDVVAVRAPDELFDIELPACGLAAAPDVGWPDIFNTGVMVLTPNLGEYQALKTQAASGDSFDGADQGLLNQAFEHRGWKRLSFKYNVTPSTSYQYEPAYRYFKRDISLVHFIGELKPWQRDRNVSDGGSYRELLARWWSVYDRHFGVSTQLYTQTGQRYPTAEAPEEKPVQENPVQVQVVVPAKKKPKKKKLPPRHPVPLSSRGYPLEVLSTPTAVHHTWSRPLVEGEKLTTDHPLVVPHDPAEDSSESDSPEIRKFVPPEIEWDATLSAPPPLSLPEATNFPTEVYEFNASKDLWRPPASWPKPPTNMRYEVPKEEFKPLEQPKPIFPWEEREMPKPRRRFADDAPPFKDESPPELRFGGDEFEVQTEKGTMPKGHPNDDPHLPFAANKNAWDDVTGIDDYVRALTAFQRSRGKLQVVEPAPPENTPAGTTGQQHILSPSNEPNAEDLEKTIAERRESLILTDFPSAVERPSLPVTPAPRRRTLFWGEERDDQGNLPAAEGVPDQADWDPNAQLEQLRRSSLVAADLQLPQKKNLPDRKMPLSAAPIPEEALGHPTPTTTEQDAAPTASASGPSASVTDTKDSASKQ